jgi:hypothetical protein
MQIMVRLHRLSVVGLRSTGQEPIQRVIHRSAEHWSGAVSKTVCVACCTGEVEVSTRIAYQLERDGISWIVAHECRIGDN